MIRWNRNQICLLKHALDWSLNAVNKDIHKSLTNLPISSKSSRHYTVQYWGVVRPWEALEDKQNHKTQGPLIQQHRNTIATITSGWTRYYHWRLLSYTENETRWSSRLSETLHQVGIPTILVSTWLINSNCLAPTDWDYISRSSIHI